MRNVFGHQGALKIGNYAIVLNPGYVPVVCWNSSSIFYRSNVYPSVNIWLDIEQLEEKWACWSTFSPKYLGPPYKCISLEENVSINVYITKFRPAAFCWALRRSLEKRVQYRNRITSKSVCLTHQPSDQHDAIHTKFAQQMSPQHNP